MDAQNIESLMNSQKLTVGDVAYVDRNAPSSLGFVNKAMARSYGQHTESLNSQSRSRNGPRNINTLTDMEFSRLLNTLNRISNM